MPPQRRGAPRVGLKRIDAALDAMRPMGFSSQLVRRVVKNLLQAYEGDQGWTFIEEGSYQILVDSILEEKERLEKEKSKLLTNSELPKGDIVTNDQIAQALLESGPSKEIQSPQTKDILPYPSTSNACKTSISTLPIVPYIVDEPSKSNSSINSQQLISIPAVNSRPLVRRRPCFGWLGDEEEEEPDVVILTPEATFT